MRSPIREVTQEKQQINCPTLDEMKQKLIPKEYPTDYTFIGVNTQETIKKGICFRLTFAREKGSEPMKQYLGNEMASKAQSV